MTSLVLPDFANSTPVMHAEMSGQTSQQLHMSAAPSALHNATKTTAVAVIA